MNIIAIIQARMGSTRLPNKVLMDICGRPMLWHIVNRVKQSSCIIHVVIATSTEPEDDEIEQFTNKYNIETYRGSRENVLQRFYETATLYKADIIVRLTGDNALIDPQIIDAGVKSYLKYKNIDYLYYREGLPVGMAVEVFSYEALKKAYLEATDYECLEHVTPYMYRNPGKFNAIRYDCVGKDYSNFRWTIDTEKDYELVSAIYNELFYKGMFHYDDILKEYQNHKAWESINNNIMQVQVTYKGENS